MRARSLALAVVLAPIASTLAAQECIGIPKGGKGFFSAGVAGSDGSSGSSLAFGYGGSRATVVAQSQSTGVFAHANPQSTKSVMGSFRIDKLRGCLVTGLSFRSWDSEGNESRGWSIDDPDAYWERHTIGGDYKRLRFPVGLSWGRTVNVGKVSFVPYVNPFVVFELEDFQSNVPNNDAPSRSRSSFGGGLETGLSMRAGWFLMRTSINIANTRHRALSGQRNWADLGLHFGVVF